MSCFAHLPRPWADLLLGISLPARQLLLIDYYYTRAYINSFALQAVVERASQSNTVDVLLDQTVFRNEHSHDFRYVNEVRESSTKILAEATKLSEDGLLGFCPARLFLRIVAASIFLLKAISLGSRETDVRNSLAQLEKCIKALKANRVDDIHLSSRYAMLIARHVRRFKRNFRVKRHGLHQSGRPSGRASPDGAVKTSGSMNNGQTEEQQEVVAASININTPGTLEQLMVDPLSDTAMYDFSQAPLPDWDDWLAQPFNPQIAPFGNDGLQPVAGLALDSLDFLWDIGT